MKQDRLTNDDLLCKYIDALKALANSNARNVELAQRNEELELRIEQLERDQHEH